MEKEKLNMLYLLKRVIKNAEKNNDTFILALLIHNIIDNNEEIKIDLDLKTIDIILYNRLVKEMDSVFEEAGYIIGNKFYDVSESVIKLLQLDSARIKANNKL